MRQEDGPSFRANESVGAFLVVAFNPSSTADKFRCELADTSTSLQIGISQHAASTDGAIDIISVGFTRAQCGASVSAGAILTWQTATGKVIEAGTQNTATAIIRTVGISLKAGSTDSVIQIFALPTYVDFG